MSRAVFEFRAPLWLHGGQVGWHFLTLPVEVAEEVRDLVPPSPRGFGSIPVTVTIGRTTWNTSIFPARASGSYDLPVKKQVREAEGLVAGGDADIVLSIEVD